MAVFKPMGKAVSSATIGAADVYQLNLTVKNSFDLIVVTGSASVTGAVWVYESNTSAGTVHKAFTDVANNQKYAVTVQKGVPLTYKFIRS